MQLLFLFMDKGHYPAEMSTFDPSRTTDTKRLVGFFPPLYYFCFLASRLRSRKVDSFFHCVSIISPLCYSFTAFCIELQLFLLFCSTFSASFPISCLQHSAATAAVSRAYRALSSESSRPKLWIWGRFKSVTSGWMRIPKINTQLHCNKIQTFHLYSI